MSKTENSTPAASEQKDAGVRWLTPETTSIYEGTFSLLHCAVKNDTLYRGVYAVRLFPVRAPHQFIALRHFDLEGQDLEIGVIPRLQDFPQEQQALVRTSLASYYYEQIISRIYRVESKYNLLFFDVETQRGREQFVMHWRTENAEDYGESGKVIIESLGNRYIIPDLSELPVADQRRFTSYVYW